MKRFLSVNEVAELFSVNPMTIYKWCKSGKLPHYTIGGSLGVSSVIGVISYQSINYQTLIYIRPRQ